MMFSKEGRTLPASGSTTRNQVLTVHFETDAAAYLWLNSSVCVLEGVIDEATGQMYGHVSVCVHELE